MGLELNVRGDDEAEGAFATKVGHTAVVKMMVMMAVCINWLYFSLTKKKN